MYKDDFDQTKKVYLSFKSFSINLYDFVIDYYETTEIYSGGEYATTYWASTFFNQDEAIIVKHHPRLFSHYTFLGWKLQMEPSELLGQLLIPGTTITLSSSCAFSGYFVENT